MDNYKKDLLLVDEEDRIIGVGKALKIHFWKYLSLHRGFSVFLFNSERKLLIQKRATGKLVFPDRWSNSVCSHPFVNDLSFTDPLLDVKAHAIRRVGYELGIKSLKVEHLELIARVLYKVSNSEVCGKLLSGDPKSQPPASFEVMENLNENYTSADFGEWEIDYVVSGHSDDVCIPNREEVAEVRYVNRNELEKIIDNSEASPWLEKIHSLMDVFSFGN